MTSKFTLSCPGTDKQTIEYSYSYPYMLKDDSHFEYTNCDGDKVKQSPCCNFNSAAQFYVFVGVMAFLYCIASLVLYVFFDDKWRNMEVLPIIDFVVCIVFTVMFLIASSAWADALTDLKHYSHPDELFLSRIPDCKINKDYCDSVHGGNFATLNVSIIFGFLNVFVWGGSVWFLLKETRFWNRDNSNVPTPQVTTPQFSTPQAPSPDQAHI